MILWKNQKFNLSRGKITPWYFLRFFGTKNAVLLERNAAEIAKQLGMKILIQSFSRQENAEQII